MIKRRFVLLLALSLALSGCAARTKNVTNLPTGVTQTQVQNWDTAVAKLHEIASTVSTLRQTVIGLNKTTYVNAQGQTEVVLPDGPNYASALRAIGKIDQLQISAANYLQGVPKNWGGSTQATVNGYIVGIQQAITDLVNQGTVGIKNSSSQSQVNQLIANLSATAQLILNLT
jgi:hypothetical protein